MRSDRVFDRHVQVDAMLIVEVDHIDAEPRQRCVARTTDVFRVIH